MMYNVIVLTCNHVTPVHTLMLPVLRQYLGYAARMGDSDSVKELRDIWSPFLAEFSLPLL